MLANIKEKNDFSSEQLGKYQKQIDEIFETVIKDEGSDKLGKALELYLQNE